MWDTVASRDAVADCNDCNPLASPSIPSHEKETAMAVNCPENVKAGPPLSYRRDVVAQDGGIYERAPARPVDITNILSIIC